MVSPWDKVFLSKEESNFFWIKIKNVSEPEEQEKEKENPLEDVSSELILVFSHYLLPKKEMLILQVFDNFVLFKGLTDT